MGLNLNIKIKHEIYEIFGIVIWAFVVGIILTQFSILALEGAEIPEIFTKNFFYTAPLVGAVLVLLVMKIMELFPNSKVNAIVHDPEQGLLANVNIFGFYPFRNIFNIILSGLIIFIPFGLLGVITNTWFGIGIPGVEQQATTGAKLIDAIEPAVSSESFVFFVLMSLYATLIKLLALKYKWSKTIYWILLLIPGTLLFGFLGLSYHNLRYGGQELILLVVAIFWGLGALMTFASQSIILFYLLHYINNFFQKLNELFANDVVIISTAIIWVMIVTLTILISQKIKERKTIKTTI